jgi:hypothetical protein
MASQEVIRGTGRVRTRSNQRSNRKSQTGGKMSNNAETLAAEYRNYAEEYGAAYRDYDYKRTNRNHDKLVALLPKLRAISDRGEKILRQLMKDPSDAVALWAATHSLPVNEEEALSVLDSIAQRGGVFGFDEKMVIKEWQSGHLKID